MSRTFGVVVALTLTLSASASLGQKATERYIPIGKSPGLSNKVTVIGPIEAVDSAARTISVGGRTVKINDKTQIWLDRSLRVQTTLDGTFADLKKGLKVECKLEEKDKKEAAEWIKVEVSG